MIKEAASAYDNWKFKKHVRTLHEQVKIAKDPLYPTDEEKARIDNAALPIFGAEHVVPKTPSYQWNLMLIAITVRPDRRDLDDDGSPIRPQDEVDLAKMVQEKLISTLQSEKEARSRRKQFRIVRG